MARTCRLFAGLTIALLTALGALAGVAEAQDGSRATGISTPEHTPPLCAEHVCVHWTDEGEDAPELDDADGDGTPDSVQRAVAAFEQAWLRELSPAPQGLGWRQPVGDAGRGGDDRADVYLGAMLYGGLTKADQGQPGPARSGYVLLNHLLTDHDERPLTLLGTSAHELHHLIQLSYGLPSEHWWQESSATWMADEVDDRIDSDTTPLYYWAHETELPLALPQRDFTATKPYGSAIFLRWLSERYGHGVVRDAWERSGAAAPNAYAPRALDDALATRATIGSSAPASFASEFSRFSAAVAEWRTPTAGFSEASRLPDVERVGRLAPDGDAAELALDHTVFALLDVPIPAAGHLRLAVKTPPGLRAAVALVGREGTDEKTASATTVSRELLSGGAATVELVQPQRFARVTAVLVNADASITGDRRDATTRDWVYTRDDQPFDARVTTFTQPAGGDRPSPAPVAPSPAPTSTPRTEVLPPAKTAPPAALRVLVRRGQRLLVRRGRLRIPVALAVRGTVVVEARVSRGDARRLELRRTVLARTTHHATRVGRQTIQLRLPEKLLRRRRTLGPAHVTLRAALLGTRERRVVPVLIPIGARRAAR